MSELILPVALWNGPPPHSVTSILLLLERSVLITGSSSGQLCIWSIETEKVTPFNPIIYTIILPQVYYSIQHASTKPTQHAQNLTKYNQDLLSNIPTTRKISKKCTHTNGPKTNKNKHPTVHLNLTKYEQPNKEGGLSPLIFCLGHTSPVTAIVECNYEERDAFVSGIYISPLLPSSPPYTIGENDMNMKRKEGEGESIEL